MTQGGVGIIYHDGQYLQHLPAHSVTAVDSTGAGDTFIGVLGASLLRNNS